MSAGDAGPPPGNSPIKKLVIILLGNEAAVQLSRVTWKSALPTLERAGDTLPYVVLDLNLDTPAELAAMSTTDRLNPLFFGTTADYGSAPVFSMEPSGSTHPWCTVRRSSFHSWFTLLPDDRSLGPFPIG